MLHLFCTFSCLTISLQVRVRSPCFSNILFLKNVRPCNKPHPATRSAPLCGHFTYVRILSHYVNITMCRRALSLVADTMWFRSEAAPPPGAPYSLLSFIL